MSLCCPKRNHPSNQPTNPSLLISPLKPKKEGGREKKKEPTSSRFDWFCLCLLLMALELMVELPTSLAGVCPVAED